MKKKPLTELQIELMRAGYMHCQREAGRQMSVVALVLFGIVVVIGTGLYLWYLLTR